MIEYNSHWYWVYARIDGFYVSFFSLSPNLLLETNKFITTLKRKKKEFSGFRRAEIVFFNLEKMNYHWKTLWKELNQFTLHFDRSTTDIVSHLPIWNHYSIQLVFFFVYVCVYVCNFDKLDQFCIPVTEALLIADRMSLKIFFFCKNIIKTKLGREHQFIEGARRAGKPS